MANEKLASLRRTRERTIATLSDAFARDDLELEEFERRLSRVHRAASEIELSEAVSDLPTTDAALVPTQQAPIGAPASPPPAQQSGALMPSRGTLLAVLGGSDRLGIWTPPQQLQVVALMGGSVLDFREAQLGPGVTSISIFAVMGGVQIIVPPTLAVEVHGAGIMGGFAHLERIPAELEPDQPRLRVGGLVVMGGVSVETRLLGEDTRDAKRRRRRERKIRRRRLRDG